MSNFCGLTNSVFAWRSSAGCQCGRPAPCAATSEPWTASLRPAPNADEGCGCVHLADVYVAFPDGSLKRPDISIFCREPDEDDEAITLLPEAVIEVISRGYEAKDLEIGPRFYLSQGIRDVVVFDPHTLMVLHLTPTSAERLVSPVDITLACGCACRV